MGTALIHSEDSERTTMIKKILIWDNDGTVSGSHNPLDTSSQAKVILPHVVETMAQADFNCMISGIKNAESEMQNFDPEKIIERFKALMEKLPLKAIAFSPMIGGVACYVVIKKSDGTISVKKAHEDPRYAQYIGEFKKPGIGMFVVMRDVAKEEFDQTIDATTTLMIGDTWHDEQAAKSFGLPFVSAQSVHDGWFLQELSGAGQ